MPITRDFTMVQVSEYMLKQRQKYESALLDILKQSGEEFIRHSRMLKPKYKGKDEDGNKKKVLSFSQGYPKSFARDQKKAKSIAGLIKSGSTLSISAGTSYQDQTANLRSSVGFMIYKDQQPVLNDFTGESDGIKAAKDLSTEVADLYAPTKGFLMVCTAGMNYAIYVEAKGYDVITGGSKVTAKYIKSRMKALHDKVSKLK